jgi:hypothetical protein
MAKVTNDSFHHVLDLEGLLAFLTGVGATPEFLSQVESLKNNHYDAFLVITASTLATMLSYFPSFSASDFHYIDLEPEEIALAESLIVHGLQKSVETVNHLELSAAQSSAVVILRNKTLITSPSGSIIDKMESHRKIHRWTKQFEK